MNNKVVPRFALESDQVDKELSLAPNNIKQITNKTGIVHAVRVEVLTNNVILDWEVAEYKWITKEEALQHDLLTGFDKVIVAVTI